MPRGDGMGPPWGSGPGTGRGSGGAGRMGDNRPGAGPGGECVCPNCGTRMQHRAGIPCYTMNCPQCGAKVARA